MRGGAGSAGVAPLQTVLALRAAAAGLGLPAFFPGAGDEPADRSGQADVQPSGDGPATTKDRDRCGRWTLSSSEDESRGQPGEEERVSAGDQSPPASRSPVSEDHARSRSPTAASVASSAGKDNEFDVTGRPSPLTMLPPTDPLTPASLLPVLTVRNQNIGNHDGQLGQRRRNHDNDDDDDDDADTGNAITYPFDSCSV